MKIYATKQTLERYNIRPHRQDISNIEEGNRLLMWGAKLFYFEGKKSIQFVNFASKLALVMIDVKKDQLLYLDVMIEKLLLELYSGDDQMLEEINFLFNQRGPIEFLKLSDKSMISTLNRTQSTLLDDQEFIRDYRVNGVIELNELHHFLNFRWFFTMKINTKTDYFYSGEKFREIVTSRYLMKKNLNLQ